MNRKRRKAIAKVTTLTGLIIALLGGTTSAEAPRPILVHETKEVGVKLKSTDLSAFVEEEKVLKSEEKLIASSITSEKQGNNNNNQTVVIAISEVTGLSQSIANTIVKESKKNGIPLHIALGMYDIETGGTFKTSMVNSSSGATGLGQIMPATGKWLAGKMGISYSYNSLKDSKYNIRMSLYYLGKLHDEFGTWHKALSAYNQGPGNVRRTGKTESKYSRVAISRAEKYKF